ncbi:hypothetical protein [Sulfuracidifex tepidarius]|uniref:Uncharacterized protein n=1 Tax=Sulfuracidifex tepidarius TaxID=1294262 RepID=A0A510DX88_9CREN|nr:hypothetical protein [Sulfuracidifex tepidarius]BBG24568.1 hypothetical protein IC006_1895 [Sulfuracidifex tepidarius]BBG27356.1 hypothetical protein IC007_1903 [Sulfuracidifex tepidarius]
MFTIKVIFGPSGDLGVLKALYKRLSLENYSKMALDIEFNLLYDDNPEIIISERQYKVPFLSELEIDEFIDRLLKGEEVADNSMIELPVTNRQYPPPHGVATAF